MSAQLVPSERLQSSNKVLFITHLALGDYTYLQSCFKAFSEAFPHLKIHIWVDELRRTSDPSKWVHLKKYALYDWLDACPFVDKVYKQTYSPELYRQSISEARQQDYPLVVSLATLRPHKYASLAREISPGGFVVGMKKRLGLFAIHHHIAYRKLDAFLDPNASPQSGPHISDTYADWFYRLFGLRVDQPLRFPFVDIPERWRQYAKEQLASWGFPRTGNPSAKIVFVNTFAKNKKRCWPLDRVVELVKSFQELDGWQNAFFIVNSMPEEMTRVQAFFQSHALERVRLFSADDNFFQLPAILEECDLIISVETAIMHLANAVRVPVVALMRKRNPEWTPIDRENSTIITVSGREDWVDTITVDQVMHVLQEKS